MPPRIIAALSAARPDLEEVARRRGALGKRIREGKFSDAADALEEWLALRAEVGAARDAAELRARLDAGDARAREDRAWLDDTAPRLPALDALMAKDALAAAARPALENLFGAPLFERFLIEAEMYRPAIAEPLKEEARLLARWRAIALGAEAGAGGALASPDRAVRLEAVRARFAALRERAAEIDEIYAGLVERRRAIAGAFGFRSYPNWRVARFNYGRDEIAAAAGAIGARLAAAQAELFRIRAAGLGVEQMLLHDEPLYRASGNARPAASAIGTLRRVREALAAARFDGRTVAALAEVEALGAHDLDARPGKDPAPFAAEVAGLEAPLVVGSWDGTSRGLVDLLRAAGDAIGIALRGELPAAERRPPAEAAGFAALALPAALFGEAERFVAPEDAAALRLEVVSGLVGTALDAICAWAFEDRVFDPDARLPAGGFAALWAEVLDDRAPWRTNPDQPVPAAETWRAERRLFERAGGAIDDAFAAVAALDLWRWARRDPRGALERYHAVVAAGGRREWPGVLTDAGLASPLDPAAIGPIAAALEEWGDDVRRA